MNYYCILNQNFSEYVPTENEFFGKFETAMPTDAYVPLISAYCSYFNSS